MFETRGTNMVTDFRNRVFSEGKAKGRAEGLAEGEVTGVLKTARNLLQLGSAIAFVVSATGLPLADVRRLAAEMR